MKYEVVQSANHADEWRVEVIDYNNEGQVLVTLSSGPQARERAMEYAEWKNSQPLTYKIEHAEWRDAQPR